MFGRSKTSAELAESRLTYVLPAFFSIGVVLMAIGPALAGAHLGEIAGHGGSSLSGIFFCELH